MSIQQNNVHSKNKTIEVYKSPNKLKILHRLNKFFLRHYFRGFYRFRNLYVKYILSIPDGQIYFKLEGKYLFQIEPKNDEGVERSMFCHGTYEQGTLYILKKCLNVDDVFIDVGANIGLMSIIASNIIGDKGKVLSFEPDSKICSILKHNIQINSVSNTTVFNFALGAKKDKGYLQQRVDANRGSNFLSFDDRNKNSKEVLIFTLDEIKQEQKISEIKLIKIDVEGWETEVLKGARDILQKSNAPILIIEFSKSQIGKDPLKNPYNYIKQINNYKFFRFKKGKEIISKLVEIKDESGLPEEDNIFCFLDKHINIIDPLLFENN